MVRPKHRSKAGERSLSVGALLMLLFAANILTLFALLPLPWLQKAFLIASPFCPQRPAHSVFIGGQQMPIEARMFGMFAGALLALLYFTARGQLGAAALPRGWRLGLCVTLFGVMVFDGTQALLYDMGLLQLYAPNLYLRLGTGLASGVGIAMLLLPLANLALWQKPRTTTGLFTGWQDVAGMAAVQAVLFAVTLANWAPVLLPLALFNSAAIITIITTLMTLVWVLITGHTARFTRLRDVVGYWAAGFILAAAFMTALALTRLALFGSGPLG
ncbi:MAG: DUF2085 domain-containing protein [Chloroflexi bacterium]|nr:DUF2085 domain-containing protein [Chloroflexota bacterium]